MSGDSERAGAESTGSESPDSGSIDSGPDGTDRVDPDRLPPEIREAVPDWDDEYLDRVGDRLMYGYDLERDYRLDGERWALHGEMRVRNEKQFLHPALSYADHEAEEFLFARREEHVTVREMERLVDLGHEVADERVDPDEEHYGTDVTFVLVTGTIPDDVREFVEGFRDRTLLKFGYYGHYDVNLVVVAPEEEAVVASEAADAAEAFTLWADVSEEREGFLSRFARRFWT